MAARGMAATVCLALLALLFSSAVALPTATGSYATFSMVIKILDTDDTVATTSSNNIRIGTANLAGDVSDAEVVKIRNAVNTVAGFTAGQTNECLTYVDLSETTGTIYTYLHVRCFCDTAANCNTARERFTDNGVTNGNSGVRAIRDQLNTNSVLGLDETLTATGRTDFDDGAIEIIRTNVYTMGAPGDAYEVISVKVDLADNDSTGTVASFAADAVVNQLCQAAGLLGPTLVAADGEMQPDNRCYVFVPQGATTSPASAYIRIYLPTGAAGSANMMAASYVKSLIDGPTSMATQYARVLQSRTAGIAAKTVVANVNSLGVTVSTTTQVTVTLSADADITTATNEYYTVMFKVDTSEQFQGGTGATAAGVNINADARDEICHAAGVSPTTARMGLAEGTAYGLTTTTGTFDSAIRCMVVTLQTDSSNTRTAASYVYIYVKDATSAASISTLVNLDYFDAFITSENKAGFEDAATATLTAPTTTHVGRYDGDTVQYHTAVVPATLQSVGSGTGTAQVAVADATPNGGTAEADNGRVDIALRLGLMQHPADNVRGAIIVAPWKKNSGDNNGVNYVIMHRYVTHVEDVVTTFDSSSLPNILDAIVDTDFSGAAVGIPAVSAAYQVRINEMNTNFLFDEETNNGNTADREVFTNHYGEVVTFARVSTSNAAFDVGTTTEAAGVYGGAIQMLSGLAGGDYDAAVDGYANTTPEQLETKATDVTGVNNKYTLRAYLSTKDHLVALDLKAKVTNSAINTLMQNMYNLETTTVDTAAGNSYEETTYTADEVFAGGNVGLYSGTNEFTDIDQLTTTTTTDAPLAKYLISFETTIRRGANSRATALPVTTSADIINLKRALQFVSGIHATNIEVFDGEADSTAATATTDRKLVGFMFCYESQLATYAVTQLASATRMQTWLRREGWLESTGANAGSVVDSAATQATVTEPLHTATGTDASATAEKEFMFYIDSAAAGTAGINFNPAGTATGGASGATTNDNDDALKVAVSAVTGVPTDNISLRYGKKLAADGTLDTTAGRERQRAFVKVQTKSGAAISEPTDATGLQTWFRRVGTGLFNEAALLTFEKVRTLDHTAEVSYASSHFKMMFQLTFTNAAGAAINNVDAGELAQALGDAVGVFQDPLNDNADNDASATAAPNFQPTVQQVPNGGNVWWCVVRANTAAELETFRTSYLGNSENLEKVLRFYNSMEDVQTAAVAASATTDYHNRQVAEQEPAPTTTPDTTTVDPMHEDNVNTAFAVVFAVPTGTATTTISNNVATVDYAVREYFFRIDQPDTKIFSTTTGTVRGTATTSGQTVTVTYGFRFNDADKALFEARQAGFDQVLFKAIMKYVGTAGLNAGGSATGQTSVNTAATVTITAGSFTRRVPAVNYLLDNEMAYTTTKFTVTITGAEDLAVRNNFLAESNQNQVTDTSGTQLDYTSEIAKQIYTDLGLDATKENTFKGFPLWYNKQATNAANPLQSTADIYADTIIITGIVSRETTRTLNIGGLQTALATWMGGLTYGRYSGTVAVATVFEYTWPARVYELTSTQMEAEHWVVEQLSDYTDVAKPTAATLSATTSRSRANWWAYLGFNPRESVPARVNPTSATKQPRFFADFPFYSVSEAEATAVMQGVNYWVEVGLPNTLPMVEGVKKASGTGAIDGFSTGADQYTTHYDEVTAANNAFQNTRTNTANRPVCKVRMYKRPAVATVTRDDGFYRVYAQIDSTEVHNSIGAASTAGAIATTGGGDYGTASTTVVVTYDSEKILRENVAGINPLDTRMSIRREFFYNFVDITANRHHADAPQGNKYDITSPQNSVIISLDTDSETEANAIKTGMDAILASQVVGGLSNKQNNILGYGLAAALGKGLTDVTPIMDTTVTAVTVAPKVVSLFPVNKVCQTWYEVTWSMTIDSDYHLNEDADQQNAVLDVVRSEIRRTVGVDKFDAITMTAPTGFTALPTSRRKLSSRVYTFSFTYEAFTQDDAASVTTALTTGDGQTSWIDSAVAKSLRGLVDERLDENDVSAPPVSFDEANGGETGDLDVDATAHTAAVSRSGIPLVRTTSFATRTVLATNPTATECTNVVNTTAPENTFASATVSYSSTLRTAAQCNSTAGNATTNAALLACTAAEIDRVGPADTGGVWTTTGSLASRRAMLQTTGNFNTRIVIEASGRTDVINKRTALETLINNGGSGLIAIINKAGVTVDTATFRVVNAPQATLVGVPLGGAAMATVSALLAALALLAVLA
ncbi:unnamed protein product [Pedinophyceae sp. YPF-701]|nr:unnamed protein product [Pedinophyceae sp. YPF-701]